jgi:hypothetical protein
LGSEDVSEESEVNNFYLSYSQRQAGKSLYQMHQIIIYMIAGGLWKAKSFPGKVEWVCRDKSCLFLEPFDER